MSDLFLIAHKVRLEPALDVAVRMDCPICAGRGARYSNEGPDMMCYECEADGFWWIIPTSGHRAYPYWSTQLSLWDFTIDCGMDKAMEQGPPEGLPDHYPPRHDPTRSIDISTLLAPAPEVKIQRRF